MYAVLTVQFHACRPPCLATRPRPKSQKAPGPAGGPFLPRALPRWLLTCFCAWGCGRREVEYRVTLRIWPPLRVVRLRPVHAVHPRSLLLLRSLPPGSAPHAVPRVPGLGHLGGFWFGATVGTAAVDVRVPAFAWVPVVIFRGSIFKSGLRFARSTVRLGSRDGDQGRVAVRWAGLVMSSK